MKRLFVGLFALVLLLLATGCDNKIKVWHNQYYVKHMLEDRWDASTIKAESYERAGDVFNFKDKNGNIVATVAVKGLISIQKEKYYDLVERAEKEPK